MLQTTVVTVNIPVLACSKLCLIHAAASTRLLCWRLWWSSNLSMTCQLHWLVCYFALSVCYFYQ